ncbi:Imm10 family immunity protein [Pectobacterium actinidiae]|uniref:Imm10 family immunity protein n=1 Tax=Pectobacterium actinidiae TaxID=1507808 RepID=UPI0023AAA4DC|nr:Imm10 family immunity protein [Pectobacterium actinidiae]WEF12588.1 Imm10 family immunity protein [Pectobacterium actinidiae]
MNVIFPAAYYDASSEEGVLTVGFADSADDPQHFLILQRAEEPDEQDEELGQDTYYAEIGNPGVAGYGGIDAVLVTANNIIFTCSSTTNWCQKIKTIEIEIEPKLGSLDDIEASLQEIFIDTPTYISRS